MVPAPHLVHRDGAGHVRAPALCEEGAALGISRERILKTTVAVTVIPCIVNSGTDVLGFASFVTAPVGAIRDLDRKAALAA